MNEKRALRIKVRERLQTLMQNDRELASRALCQRSLAIGEVSRAQTVMAFVPMGDEPDIRPLIEELLFNDKSVLLPKMQDDTIIPVRYLANETLIRSCFGSLEPDVCFAAPAHEIDVIFVPGVAFDENGHRMGRGKGHYDRFLAPLNCIKIGLCFETQIEDFVPSEPHDIWMDAVVTDKRLIVCKKDLRLSSNNKP